MGKVKNLRQKFHISKQAGDSESKAKTDVPKYTPLMPTFVSENVFAGLNISFDSLNKKLEHAEIPEDKTPQEIATTDVIKFNSKEKAANKKDKIRLRREGLLKKIDAVQQAKKEAKQRLKRQKTAIIGDLHPLKDALPSLDSLLKLKPHPEAIKTGISNVDAQSKFKNRGPMKSPLLPTSKLGKKARKELKQQKIKKLAKEYKQRYNNFQRVLADETFKKNPREAIAMHIKLTLADEAKVSVADAVSTGKPAKVTHAKITPATASKNKKR